MAWIRIAAVADVKPGTLVHHDLNDADSNAVVLCNHEGELHAFNGLCPHQNGPLGQGNLTDGRIICPWHAWEFDCRSGEYDYNPAIQLKRYGVKTEGGDVFVEVP